MNDAHTEQHAFTLRSIADRMGLEPVKRMVRQPGMRAVYRLIIFHHDRRAADSVATLYHTGPDKITLSLAYERAFHHQPLIHSIPFTRYEALTLALQNLHFDHLPDQRGMPFFGVDLWMIERAAGTFIKSVIIAPQTAGGSYAGLVTAIHTHLPEALREITQTS